jgi:hypothetical protein
MMATAAIGRLTSCVRFLWVKVHIVATNMRIEKPEEPRIDDNENGRTQYAILTIQNAF